MPVGKCIRPNSFDTKTTNQDGKSYVKIWQQNLSSSVWVFKLLSFIFYFGREELGECQTTWEILEIYHSAIIL